MSTAERKARKRAGEKAPVKPIKVATPVEDRAEFGGLTIKPRGTKGFADAFGQATPRSPKRLERALAARDFGGDAA